MAAFVSNTPMQYVLELQDRRSDMCVFQVDLFSARGRMPQALTDVAQREKEIPLIPGGRTRFNTDKFLEMQTLRRALKTPSPRDCRFGIARRSGCQGACGESTCDAAVTIVHLIHRRAAYDRYSMDYEFSRLSMLEHWQAGLDDVRHTLKQPEWINRKKPEFGVKVFDLTRDEESEMRHEGR